MYYTGATPVCQLVTAEFCKILFRFLHFWADFLNIFRIFGNLMAVDAAANAKNTVFQRWSQKKGRPDGRLFLSHYLRF